jgi:uncharacterized protein (DUF934 family)
MAELLVLDARARAGEPEVTVAPGEDVRASSGLLADLSNVGIVGVLFPKFRDGRGYSTARILREEGFSGDVRAVGDVTLDQLVFLKRAGFSSVAPERAITREDAERTLARWRFFYQRGSDGSPAAFEVRNGHADR